MRRIPNGMFAWLLITPAMIILLGFSVLPMITTIWTSLQEPGIGASIGPANYERMVGDGVFLQSLRNNLVFSLVTVPISLAIAMLMAVLVDREIRARGFLRMAFFTPAMLPVVAAAAIWLAFYQPNFGLINAIAQGLGLPGQNWLGNPTTVLPALMVVMVWKEAGFFMLFYLAGLQTISPELNEASKLEGTGRWTHFRRITFPLLLPTTLFTSIVGVANSFKQIDFIFVMTQGGPNNASNLLLYNIYLQAFPNRNPEFAAAMTAVLVLILVVLAVIQIRMFDKRIHYR
ncbi:sugar ABC transporter permease [Egibacter rhizosphaerae]|uniref:Sugar ABC transporter permease n=1 Tax=Egibacter rhizosphaerae TaxID=1670831 RepID=A0A411YL34_9ACTN|nr:sugar ABC transporter permease [Egibacter rhizosphaerae]